MGGGLRLSPIRSCGEGRLACWACWDRGPLGLDFGPRAHFDQTLKRPYRCSDFCPAEHAQLLEAFRV
eukprot:15445818-Alexandrium_andersonii.AAC.1